MCYVWQSGKAGVRVPFTKVLRTSSEECREYLRAFKCDGDVWILKPSYMNRGQGIELFRGQESFEETMRGLFPLYGEGEEVRFSECKCREVVLQKYVMNPLLFEKRKFDIRVWVLLTTDARNSFYLFK